MAKIIDKLAGIFERQRSAAREISDAIEGPRVEIMALYEKRREIKAAPISPAEVQTRIKETLAAAEAETRIFFHPDALITPPDSGFVTDARLAEAFAAKPLGMMIVLGFREEITEALTAAANKEVAGRGRAYSADERAKELARIDAEIREAERDEEKLCRLAEEAGISVARRADANMEFILAEDL
ncbi:MULTISPECIES: hypothetical protein [unclassified Mesorhizobium]|uniref:hypothetical protein n=1 Tax=unclassified Mesorhizobium TaxID=325217 RepID=UPI000FD4992A|nr:MULTISPECIES: hypothetical protein [unclassified Mesorhizobium]RVB72137.1 hypothetical protein EN885_30290 [Mesorhizobium sp. M6A.T.Cr.TU.014.01.1.1]RWP96299.1 MAG: hypothetical protein EOR91_31310 [Mesorhizobium sp.]RWP96408.1 MAG: hypothetical protein EOR90_29965 [Mesorhizobium sp.]